MTGWLHVQLCWSDELLYINYIVGVGIEQDVTNLASMCSLVAATPPLQGMTLKPTDHYTCKQMYYLTLRCVIAQVQP